MKKTIVHSFSAFIILAALQSCGEASQQLEDKLNQLNSKANQLDSLVNKEIEKVSSLDSLRWTPLLDKNNISIIICFKIGGLGELITC